MFQNSKREIFGFRKYKAYGLASAVIAAFFLMGGVASADEVTTPTVSDTPALTTTSPTLADSATVEPSANNSTVASGEEVSGNNAVAENTATNTATETSAVASGDTASANSEASANANDVVSAINSEAATNECSQDFKSCASANFAIRAFMEAGGFEPPNPKERIYSPPQLAALLCFLLTLTGFEPVTTYRISALTTFAPGQNNA